MSELMVSNLVKECIRLETGYTEEILDSHSADDIDGWDSITHVRIMYRIDFQLGVEMDLIDTYSCDNIGELVDLVERNLK